jgi:hypothetical protein
MSFSFYEGERKMFNQEYLPCNRQIHIKLSDKELEMIRDRMEQMGFENMSAYIRKMAIDGLIIRVDTSDLTELSRLVRINANNLNQYTKRANETGSIYLEDIKELNAQQEKIWIALKEVWGLFASMGI